MAAIYLDHNAGAPLDKRVLEAMLPYLKEQQGNPSSVHRYGRIAKEAIEHARIQIANLIHAEPSQIIFTSGGTEANNLALFGTVKFNSCDRLIVSGIEHSSILEPTYSLQIQGLEAAEIKPNCDGKITLDSLKGMECKANQLVSILWASNETGVLQDIPQLSQYVQSCHGIFHTDAVQAIGKIPINFSENNIHLMSISAHKMGGPKGVGALVIDSALDIDSILFGGGQERGLRSGTENVAAIVGFGKAAEIANEELTQRMDTWYSLRSYLEYELRRELPDIIIFSEKVERLPNTIFFSFPGIEGETLLMALDKVGIAVSSGSACDSNGHQPSHVLLAMGVDPTLAQGAIRVSIGAGNTLDQINKFILVLKREIENFKKILIRN
ncbi:cysteine desulfurase family protein [Candidatus Nitrosacidococcus tergens]|uniref:cysteine desulfurase n=1 Tax=Candidatus Nitrosacidococcus tergens TaxID=553981 RepID=A0A7G1Q9X0_9GAMM|nr:cysteine desulfurase family protein [Candidatus Nitrosacidococcus tergens]CAB1275611.1 Cysteine desulfurase [Candidatus Nitrosacidococcus tergens]